MSQLPSDPSGPRYAAYPRGIEVQWSVEQLNQLAKGHSGLNKAFIAGLAVQAFAVVLCTALGWVRPEPILLIGSVVDGYVVMRVSYPALKKIGEALDWRPFTPAIVALGLGLQAWVFFGALGITTVQGKVVTELKKYGLRPGFRGFSRKEIARVVRQIEAQHASISTMRPTLEE